MAVDSFFFLELLERLIIWNFVNEVETLPLVNYPIG